MTPLEFAKMWYSGAPDTELTQMRIDGLASQIEMHFIPKSAQQGNAAELLPSGDFADDFDHEQLGMLPKDAIPQSAHLRALGGIVRLWR